MFCPVCGAPDQTPETYCRQCGVYLPDLNKPVKRKHTPEEHIKVNSVLNLLSALVSVILAGILYGMFAGRDGTPLIIYITAAFLTANFAWQVQTFWRTRQLKKHFQKNKPQSIEDEATPAAMQTQATTRLLDKADISDVVPFSVVERTTRALKKGGGRGSSQTKH